MFSILEGRFFSSLHPLFCCESFLPPQLKFLQLLQRLFSRRLPTSSEPHHSYFLPSWLPATVSYFQHNDVLSFENCRLPVDECLDNEYFSGNYEGKEQLGSIDGFIILIFTFKWDRFLNSIDLSQDWDSWLAV